MNLLSEVINRLNQRIGVANIFDKQFGLCELNANGNEKAWIHYIGDGQGEVVTNFDAKQGTIFWAKRGKVNISIIDSLKVSGCKKMYQTTFPLTAYAIVRKSHLPCDSEDAQDWIASRVFKLTSGMDYGFKQSIGVMSYEVIPNGYANEIKSLTQNYEWACVSIDIDVQIVSSADDGCYDTCQTGDIPLPPNYAPCTPCLTEVAVDGVTITGDGTPSDPLVATGVTAGGTIIVKDEGTTISPAATTVNFTGAGVTSSLTSPGVVEVNVSASGTQVNSDWNAVSGVAEILNKPTIPTASAANRGALSSTDWSTFNGKQNALGFTPVTNARTLSINGTAYDLTSDRSWTVPETKVFLSTADSTAITGVTTNQLAISVLIPAGTYAVGDVIDVDARVFKTGGNGITTLRTYVNTENSISSPAPTLLTTGATGANGNTLLGIDRSLIIKSATVTQTVAATVNVVNESIAGNAGVTNSNIDWSVDQYFIFAIQNGSALDRTVVSYFTLLRKRA